MRDIRPGMTLRVRDARGDWHEAEATSSPQRGDKFPIVWVRFTTRGEPVPWPLGAIEPGDQP